MLRDGAESLVRPPDWHLREDSLFFLAKGNGYIVVVFSIRWFFLIRSCMWIRFFFQNNVELNCILNILSKMCTGVLSLMFTVLKRKSRLEGTR